MHSLIRFQALLCQLSPNPASVGGERQATSCLTGGDDQPQTNTTSLTDDPAETSFTHHSTQKSAMVIASASVTCAPFKTSLVSDETIEIESLLPASFRTADDDVIPTSTDPQACVASELDLHRPRQIYGLLWLAGRPRLPRPLHYQIVVSREVFITERMDMHLVRTKRQVFIKPIPRYLLRSSLWDTFLGCSGLCRCATTSTLDKAEECERKVLWKVAFGFLVSYAGLIAHESDLALAQEKLLVPRDITWKQWRLFANEILVLSKNSGVDGRFHYGELSLERLSKLYRLKNSRTAGDYLLQWRHHSPFFSARFQWLAMATVYIALVLAAMQVGLGTKYLSESKMFNEASYGFVVFAIAGPLAVMLALVVENCYVAVTNAMATMAYKRRRLGVMQKDGEDV